MQTIQYFNKIVFHVKRTVVDIVTYLNRKTKKQLQRNKCIDFPLYLKVCQVNVVKLYFEDISVRL